MCTAGASTQQPTPILLLLPVCDAQLSAVPQYYNSIRCMQSAMQVAGFAGGRVCGFLAGTGRQPNPCLLARVSVLCGLRCGLRVGHVCRDGTQWCWCAESCVTLTVCSTALTHHREQSREQWPFNASKRLEYSKGASLSKGSRSGGDASKCRWWWW